RATACLLVRLGPSFPHSKRKQSVMPLDVANIQTKIVATEILLEELLGGPPLNQERFQGFMEQFLEAIDELEEIQGEVIRDVQANAAFIDGLWNHLLDADQLENFTGTFYRILYANEIDNIRYSHLIEDLLERMRMFDRFKREENFGELTAQYGVVRNRMEQWQERVNLLEEDDPNLEIEESILAAYIEEEGRMRNMFMHDEFDNPFGELNLNGVDEGIQFLTGIIENIYARPAPGRNEVATIFDSLTWVVILGRTLLQKFSPFWFEPINNPALAAALDTEVNWARQAFGIGPIGNAETTAAEDADGLLTDMRRKTKELYAQRAYSRLAAGALFQPLPADGQHNIIEQRSRVNLQTLNEQIVALGGIDEMDRTFLDLFRLLPFYGKHATSEGGWNAIVHSNTFLSKVGLFENVPNPYISASGFTTMSDELDKQDIDFVFFRVEIGSELMANTRYGEYQFGFPLEQFMDVGWVSLHDLLEPITSLHRHRQLRDISGQRMLRFTHNQVVNGSPNPQGTDPAPINISWRHIFFDPGRLADGLPLHRTINMLDEVYYGEDILEGMAYSVLRDLKDMPFMRNQVYESFHVEDTEPPQAFIQLMKNLFPKLYRPEIKYPAYFPADSMHTEGAYTVYVPVAT
ncbi:MAG: hypothetical protein AAF824_23140, partial [Bacteroidota bacterium]